MQKFAGPFDGGARPRREGIRGLAVWCWAALFLLAGAARSLAAPLNDNFANAVVISGVSGNTSGNNLGATLQTGEPTAVATADDGKVNVAGSVWFLWTAPSSGNATFDTIGSTDINYNQMDTVLAVYTGSAVTNLTLVAANDNVSSSNVNSSVTFFATGGTTYYVAVDLNASAAGQPGNYLLNWNETGAPIAGEFRLTSPTYTFSLDDGGSGGDSSTTSPSIPARATVTRVGGASGKVEVQYVVSGAYYTNLYFTNIYSTNVFVSLVDSNANPLGYTNASGTIYNATVSLQNFTAAQGYYYTSSQSSAFEGITNNNGGVAIYYTNGLPYVQFPPNTLGGPGITILVTNADLTVTTAITNLVVVTNADLSVTSITTSNTLTMVTLTNVVSSLPGFTFPVGGTLTFDDFQMNQDISLPFSGNPANIAGQANGVLVVTLVTNYLDPLELQTIPAPTIQSNRSTSLIALLNPAYESPPWVVSGGVTTNVVSLERSTLRCSKGVGTVRVGVVLTRGNNATANQEPVTVSYEIDHILTDDDDNTFTLQAGSDYARPDDATKSGVQTSADFTSVTGTLTWGPNNSVVQYINIPITQDNLVKFNRDFLVQLGDPGNPNCAFGNISTANVTILYSTPPAGANDVGYNSDGNVPPSYPNPGANGVVYAAVVQPSDSKAVIAGDFTGYTSTSQGQQNHIARLTTSGELDSTFISGAGFDDDVLALALDASENIIAVGAFHSYNNSQTLTEGIARLLPNGSMDPTFNTGVGANSTVWTTVVDPNGQILIGGDFTTFNGTNRNYIARLNGDGSVDATFNPGIGPNADVYAISVQTNGQIVIGGAFTSVDGTNLNYIARLNADGSLDTSFNPGYGFGANNTVNAVAVQPNGQILLGGLFTQVGNLGGEGIARLNSDGTVDTGFYTGTGTSDEVNTISLQSDGTILIGGWFTSYNGTRRVSYARLLADGALDTSFMDPAYNQFAGLINPYYNPNVNSPNPVYALAVQPDGNYIVGGSFYQIGGGGTRDDIHPRLNVARVIGGSTPGPGDLELSLQSYTAQNSSPQFYVLADRQNGTLGPVSATVNAIPTGTGVGYAAYGVDYTFAPVLATWGVSWNGTWMLSDGREGTNNNGAGSAIYVNIISNNNNNVSLDLGMTQPKEMDTFFLGGVPTGGGAGLNVATVEGENIPLGVGLANTLASLTIIHNNTSPGVFNFSSSYYYVSENSANIVIPVTRSGGTANEVTVHYATSDGTALAGTDYRKTSGTLTFLSGSSTPTQPLTVPIINGTTARPDRVFNVALTVPGGGAALGTVTNAQVEIVNDNFSAGHVEFAYGNFGLNGTNPVVSFGTNENSGALQVVVARLGGSAGLLTVDVATTDGSALNGVNYLGLTNVLTWTNGDASLRTINLPVLDDGVITTNLVAGIGLYNPTVNNTNAPLALGGVYTNATLIISNVDSPGTIEFTAPSYTVNENAGYAIVPVIRTGGNIGTLTVGYWTTNGTAAAGTNYVAASGTLTFGPGQVSTNFIVTILNQGTPWVSPLNFGLVLTSPGYTNALYTNILGSPVVAQMNINGSQAFNDPPGQPNTGYSPLAGFNDTVLALALQPDGKLLAGGDFTTADGVPRSRLARLNTDGSLDTTFSSYLPGFGANATVRSIAVQDNGLIVFGGFFTNYNSAPNNYITRINENGLVDSGFNIGAGPNNPVYAIASAYENGVRTTILGGAFTMVNGTPRNAIARLSDNGTVDASFNPGQGANATVYALAVQTDGKVVIGGDFTTVNGTNLNHIARLNVDGSVDATFNPGLGANASVRAIAIQLDGNILIGGLFTNVNNVALNYFARLQANGAVDPTFNVGAGANAPVEAIALQTDTRIVVAGNFTECSGVSRNGITRLNPDGTVDSTINFGSGADNYVAAVVMESDGNIDLGGGFLNYDGVSHPYYVQIYGGSLAGSGAIQFGATSYQVDERGTNALISVIRTGGTSGTNADGSGDIYITFATSPGTAVPGTNYTTVVTNVDFRPGEVLQTVAIPVFDDGVVTPNLTVTMTLTNPTPPAVIGNAPSATLTIINDDSSVSFAQAAYSVAKNVPGGEAIIGLDRSGSLVGTTTVNFATTSGGTAVIGTDYTPVNQTVIFTPGISNVNVNVPINNNGLVEGNRTIPMQLSAPAGAYLASPTNTVLTIIDTVQAPGEFEFSATNYNVTEGGGVGYSTATVTVVRTNGTSGIVSVNYTTVDGTAASVAKYVGTNSTLNFLDGQSVQSFTVPVVNTTTAEGAEYFSVVLSNPTGGAGLAAPTNATITILNTNTGITFASTSTAFTEPSNGVPGTVSVNVLRLNNTNGVTTVEYSTQNGTAVAGTNFVGITNAVLTFAPGISETNFLITTLHDPRPDRSLDLDFTVGLFNPSAGAQLTAPTNTTLIDEDSDAELYFLTTADRVDADAWDQYYNEFVLSLEAEGLTPAEVGYPDSIPLTDTVYENAQYAYLVVYSANTNVAFVSVNYATSDGTAKAGADYIATSGTLTFYSGEPYNLIEVPIIPSSEVQSNKQFTVTLSDPTPPGVLPDTTLHPSTVQVTIISTNTPYGLSFSTPLNISGTWGSVTVDNTTSVAQNDDPIIAGNPPTAPVWFQWTAPANGEVTMDTIGSLSTNGIKLDTVLGVYTGVNLNSLSQVAANDDMYPLFLAPDGQINYDAQNIYSTGLGYTNNTISTGNGGRGGNGGNGGNGGRGGNGGNGGTGGNGGNGGTGVTAVPQPVTESVVNDYYQPFGGPSEVRFNARAGVTYYIAVDTKSIEEEVYDTNLLENVEELTGGQGLVSLNWAYHSSGVFRFATERVDLTGLIGSNGIAPLLYECAETESDEDVENVNATAYDTTHDSYYDPNAAGLLVTVTRVAGSSGRVWVDYTTVDGDPTVITNGDNPALGGTDYEPVSGTLVFDDFEMSKTILIPIIDDLDVPQPNRDFNITLSNPRLDPNETGDVSAPRVDPVFGSALCRILDCNIDPAEAGVIAMVTTNTVFGTTNVTVTTNYVANMTPTNAVFNFSKANYRVPRDISQWTGTPVTVYVNRSGTNLSQAVTLHYRIDGYFLDSQDATADNNEFPLQPGSDYATPTPASTAGINGRTSDFNGGDGTITFPAKKTDSQPIQFTVSNNKIPEFNKDIHITLFAETSDGTPYQVGMVAECTVTILFDDLNPPAGSVDEFYNQDFAADNVALGRAGLNGSTVANPGTELYSEVYSVAVLPDNGGGSQSLIAGAFTTYEDENNTYTVNGIARLNNDGTLDPTFNPGSGVNVFPGGQFIRTAQLTASGQILIAGNFDSYNGVQRNCLAQLNPDGTLDTTFTPGAGANGTVWAMAQQADGRVIIGGDFTTYNNTPAVHVARINMDGSLDTTFNTGTNLNGSVYAVAVEADNNAVVLGGNFTAFGGAGGQNYIIRLNPDGSQDTTFNTITGPNGAVRTVAFEPNDEVLAGGDFTLVAGQSDQHIVLFNTNGVVDTTFNAGTGTDGTVYNINYNSFTTSTTTITTNATTGVVTTNTTYQTANTLYVGGTFTTFNGTRRAGFARLYLDGSVDTTFLDTAYNQFAGLHRIFYGDAPGTVYSSGVQDDGNILIVGSFQSVGGGAADKNCLNTLDEERGVAESFDDPYLWVSEGGSQIEPHSRDGVRIHSNVARLIGGATPGPGNIGLVAPSYSVNKTQPSEPISLVRTNGTLGWASANFSVVSGLAQSGQDYIYDSPPPIYPIGWEYYGPSRLHSDGLFGGTGLMQDIYGGYYKMGTTGPASVNISIINDTAVAGNLDATLQLANPVDADQFYLGGQNIPLGLALGESKAPLLLVDNSHQDGVFGFAANSYTATNSLVNVGLVRTNSSIGTVQVFYETVTNGTAILGTDYRPTNGVVTFNPSQTISSFPVQILENSYISSVEKTVGLELYNIQDLSSGDASLGQTNAVIRIINPNYQGYLNFSASMYSANLSAGAIAFTVQRTVGSKGTLTVTYATTNGTAVSGTDYVGATNTLTWYSGDVTPRTVSIPLLPSSAVGPGKQFGVNLFNPTLNFTNWPSLLESPTNAILFINNNNSYGVFQFSAPQYLVNENGGYATVTVTRTGAALGTASVAFATADGPAVGGVNYVRTNNVLNFAAGQLSASFNVPILAQNTNTLPPSSFYFNVALSNPNPVPGAGLGTLTNATVNIVATAAYNQPPGSPDPTFDPEVNFNGSVLALALQSNGQIVAGGVFTSVDGANLSHLARLNTDGTLDTSFLSGLSAADDNVNAVLSQTDDRILIGGAFTNVNGGVYNHVARVMTDGTIDTSFQPGAGADNAVYALAETFQNGARELYVGGAFSTFDGTSSPGVVRLDNYGAVDDSFATGLGANGAVYAIAVYPTNAVYNNGSVLVGGSFTNFSNVVVGNLVRLTLNGSVDTSFNLYGGANSTVRAIAIQTDGKILIGGDFTNVDGVAVNHLARLNSDGSLDQAFATNLISGFNGTVEAIAIQPDNRIVVSGQFDQANGVNRNDITRLLPSGAVDTTINFGDGANGAIDALLIQPANDFLVIGGAFTEFDDQKLAYIARLNGGSQTGSGLFDFNSASYQIDENGGFATITVIRAGGSSGPNADGSGNVQVNFATSNGTAAAGVNYQGVTNTLVFAPGEEFQTIYVPVMNDGNVDPNLTVNLTLSSPLPTPQAGLGDQSTAQLTIINDNSGVAFSSVNYSVPKDTVNGVATITLDRLGSTSGGCTVTFATTTNGTALAGVDYYPTNVTVTFNPGQASEMVQVQIINNTIPEGQRTVDLVLTNATGVVLASPTNAILTIIDTVDAPGQLYFATNSYTVVKANGIAYLTVDRTNGFSGNVSVNYNTVAGTASAGLNYLSSSGTLTLGDGVTSGQIAIPVVTNSLVQGTVYFSVDLSNPAGGATLVVPTNAVVNILDQNVGVTFENATNTALETAASANVLVERIGPTNAAFTVRFATYNLTAVPGVNFTPVSGTLDFAPGQTFETINVPLIYDPQVTGNLLFGVRLSQVTGEAQLVSPTNALVVIQDANAGLSFTNAATSVLRAPGSVTQLTLPVICSNPQVEPPFVNSNSPLLTVNYYTTNGSATAGLDYTAVSGTLTFTNGIATNYITVPILPSTALGSNVTFNVVLANPTAPGQVVAPGTNTVTIVNVNSGVEFSAPAYTVLKTGIQATINVLRTGYTNSTVSVNYNTTNGTAVAGINYVPAAGTLTFTNGQTSNSFTVPIISSTAVQPDLTVLLQLSDPVAAALAYPSFSTLTIVDLSGSFVVPSGVVLVTNQIPTNGIAGPPNLSGPFVLTYTPGSVNGFPGIIYPGMTNTLKFGFRVSSGTNVPTLVATLLATNGITNPSGPRTNGPLIASGPSVAEQFTFTASSSYTNGQTIQAAFALTDAYHNSLGTNTFTFQLGTWTAGFSNAAPIVINAQTSDTANPAQASPYPSVITVSGLSGVLLKTTVTFTNLTATEPDAIQALVVAPDQQDTVLMSDAGVGSSINNVTLMFDDAATNVLTYHGQITNGVYRPTHYSTPTFH